MKRKAKAQWIGTGLEGTGNLTTGSKAFNQHPYSYKTRFENEDGTLGTNPEELIAAAHAGCFTMALSFQLGGAGHPPQKLETEAILTMENEGVHYKITRIELSLKADVPGIDSGKFQELARNAKETCPVSQALSAVAIVLNAELV